VTRNTRFSLKLPSTGDTASVRSEPWHAVAIRTGKWPCTAAEDAAGTRFLATEAPMLPLPNCDRGEHCECRYRHFADRRRGPRRKADGAPPTTAPQDGTGERRCKQQGRREDDWIPEEPREERPSLTEDSYYEYVSKLGK